MADGNVTQFPPKTSRKNRRPTPRQRRTHSPNRPSCGCSSTRTATSFATITTAKLGSSGASIVGARTASSGCSRRSSTSADRWAKARPSTKIQFARAVEEGCRVQREVRHHKRADGTPTRGCSAPRAALSSCKPESCTTGDRRTWCPRSSPSRQRRSQLPEVDQIHQRGARRKGRQHLVFPAVLRLQPDRIDARGNAPVRRRKAGDRRGHLTPKRSSRSCATTPSPSPVTMFTGTGWRALEYYRAKPARATDHLGVRTGERRDVGDAFVNELTGSDMLSGPPPGTAVRLRPDPQARHPRRADP